MKLIRPLLFLCILAGVGGLIGYSLSKWFKTNYKKEFTVEGSADGKFDQVLEIKYPRETSIFDQTLVGLEMDFPKNAIRGELVLQFDNAHDYTAYLKALSAKGISPLGQIDELLVLRVDTLTLARISRDGYNTSLEYSYEVIRPVPPMELSPEALAKLRGYGQSAREIVGGLVDGDGSGVMVAILDSGICENEQFNAVTVAGIDLVGEGIAGEGAAHGTSVASIVAGSEGVAPSSELLAIRVLDEHGQGNSFHVAQGIVQAVDLGADIINLSLAVYQDSPVLRNAVTYARSKDVLLVAAAGNDGYNQMPFPAAYVEVISVTAIDANHRHALFPNQSTKIDFAAPGVSILTAAEEAGTTLFTGTSAAAPFVSGTLASMLSENPNQSSQQAIDTLKRHLNEAGSAGEDALYGDGVLDWNRLRERNTPGILDIALAEIHLDHEALPGTTMPVEVTVQNRGTKWFPESELEVIVGDMDPVSFTLGSLGPGSTTTRKVYTQVPTQNTDSRLEILARVLPEDVNQDVRLENNLKGALYQAK